MHDDDDDDADVFERGGGKKRTSLRESEVAEVKWRRRSQDGEVSEERRAEKEDERKGKQGSACLEVTGSFREGG